MTPKTTADPLAEFKALVIGRALGCSIGKAIDDLAKSEYADDIPSLKLALGQPVDEIPHAAISRWLGARGHKIAAHTVGRHRSHECSCPCDD